LNKERFIDFLNSFCLFSHRRGDGSDTHRTTFEFLDDGCEDTIIHLVEAVLVDVEGIQRELSDSFVDDAITLDLRKVAGTSQEVVGDTRSAPASTRDLECSVVVYLCVQNSRRPLHNAGE